MLSYQIDPEAEIVEIAGPPVDDIGELAQCLTQVLADRAYRPGFGFLRHGESADAPSPAVVRESMMLLARLGLGASRWAIVAQRPAEYGMVRMAQLMSDGSPLEIGIFPNRDAAWQWLRKTLESEPQSVGGG